MSAHDKEFRSFCGELLSWSDLEGSTESLQLATPSGDIFLGSLDADFSLAAFQHELREQRSEGYPSKQPASARACDSSVPLPESFAAQHQLQQQAVNSSEEAFDQGQLCSAGLCLQDAPGLNLPTLSHSSNSSCTSDLLSPETLSPSKIPLQPVLAPFAASPQSLPAGSRSQLERNGMLSSSTLQPALSFNNLQAQSPRQHGAPGTFPCPGRPLTSASPLESLQLNRHTTTHKRKMPRLADHADIPVHSPSLVPISSSASARHAPSGMQGSCKRSAQPGEGRQLHGHLQQMRAVPQPPPVACFPRSLLCSGPDMTTDPASEPGHRPHSLPEELPDADQHVVPCDPFSALDRLLDQHSWFPTQLQAQAQAQARARAEALASKHAWRESALGPCLQHAPATTGTERQAPFTLHGLPARASSTIMSLGELAAPRTLHDVDSVQGADHALDLQAAGRYSSLRSISSSPAVVPNLHPPGNPSLSLTFQQQQQQQQLDDPTTFWQALRQVPSIQQTLQKYQIGHPAGNGQLEMPHDGRTSLGQVLTPSPPHATRSRPDTPGALQRWPEHVPGQAGPQLQQPLGLHNAAEPAGSLKLKPLGGPSMPGLQPQASSFTGTASEKAAALTLTPRTLACSTSDSPRQWFRNAGQVGAAAVPCQDQAVRSLQPENALEPPPPVNPLQASLTSSRVAHKQTVVPRPGPRQELSPKKAKRAPHTMNLPVDSAAKASQQLQALDQINRVFSKVTGAKDEDATSDGQGRTQQQPETQPPAQPIANVQQLEQEKHLERLVARVHRLCVDGAPWTEREAAAQQAMRAIQETCSQSFRQDAQAHCMPHPEFNRVAEQLGQRCVLDRVLQGKDQGCGISPEAASSIPGQLLEASEEAYQQAEAAHLLKLDACRSAGSAGSKRAAALVVQLILIFIQRMHAKRSAMVHAQHQSFSSLHDQLPPLTSMLLQTEAGLTQEQVDELVTLREGYMGRARKIVQQRQALWQSVRSHLLELGPQDHLAARKICIFEKMLELRRNMDDYHWNFACMSRKWMMLIMTPFQVAAVVAIVRQASCSHQGLARCGACLIETLALEAGCTPAGEMLANLDVPAPADSSKLP